VPKIIKIGMFQGVIQKITLAQFF